MDKVGKNRRSWGEGSVYQRASDGRWIAAFDVVGGDGGRRRVTVSVRSTGNDRADRNAVLKKLRKKQQEIEQNGVPTQSANTTVKQWAAVWLDMKQATLRPKAWNAAASPVRKWIMPTIGHKRLDALTPADVRAVADVQRAAGLKASTAGATHRVLLNMLRSAIVEGHQVPQRVLMVKSPQAGRSDRTALTLEETIEALRVAEQLQHGTRWAMALLYGTRQGESLGMTWDSIDFDAEVIRVEWQLQALPYVDRADKTKGFRVPDDLEARHLVDAWHLLRPKSKAGVRVLPLLPAFADALHAWREVAPANPWGLVWPTAGGRPANNRHDLEEWHALQGTAGVGHPDGRYYHVHECRNVAATLLDESGASENVITSLLGHASIVTSRGYMRVHAGPKREAITQVAARLNVPRSG